jgi:hypothetical protein
MPGSQGLVQMQQGQVRIQSKVRDSRSTSLATSIIEPGDPEAGETGQVLKRAGGDAAHADGRETVYLTGNAGLLGAPASPDAGSMPASGDLAAEAILHVRSCVFSSALIVRPPLWERRPRRAGYPTRRGRRTHPATALDGFMSKAFSSDGFRSGLRVFAISYVFGAALSRAKDVPAGKPALPVKPATNRRVLLIGNCPVPQESEIRCWIVSKEASPDGRPV